MSGTTQNISPHELSMLDKFKKKAADFMQAVNSLYSLGTIPPSLQNEYSSLRSTADDIKSSIKWITGTVDSVTNFFSNTFSLNGSDYVSNYINGDSSQNMGFISLIPLAAIIGSMALMTKFISDVYVFEQKLSEQKRLEKTGLTPGAASKIVDNMQGNTLKSLSTLVKPIAITVSLIYGAKIIKDFIK